MKPQSIVTVDAFTSEPFRGNPAAVCVLDVPAHEPWMRAVAAEMNLAETAFLWRESDDAWRLRWFTPKVEVDLCGHATLAAAHVLWESGVCPQNTSIRFKTRSGMLIATRRGDWIELDFPTLSTDPCEPPQGLAEALNIISSSTRDAIRFVGRTPFDLFVEVESESMLRSLEPDFRGLKPLAPRGVIVTSRPNDESRQRGFDFISRFFAPAAGIDEDPVTGSAHCALGAYWQAGLGKDSLLAYQASPRGGVVRLRVAGDRTILGGQAVTVLQATLSNKAALVPATCE